MGAGKFTRTDSDLLGLLQKNGLRIIRELSQEVQKDKADTNNRLDNLRQEAVELRNQLLSDLDNVQGQIDSLNLTLNGEVGAENGLAQLVEQMRLTIEASALRIEEAFAYAMELRDENSLFQLSIDSTIRRGYLNDPGGGNPIFGIAIAQNLVFTDEETNYIEQDGVTYYELESSQTLGLYTATGWQFWINGTKAGWFSAEDGMLHVPNIVVEETLILGNDWRITTTGGFGIKYVG